MQPNHNKTPRPDSCPVEGQCIFEQQKDIWLDSKFLKTAGVIIGLLTPLFAWIIIEIFTLKGSVDLIKQRQETIMEIKTEIQEMRKDLTAIKIQIAGITQGKP